MIKIIVILAAVLLSAMPVSELGNMNVVIMGDNITWLGNDDCTGAKGWTSRWKELANPKTCRSYARSGATWCNTPETKVNLVENIGIVGKDNTIFNQVMRLADAVKSGSQPIPDLVIIAAGTNDLSDPRRRPQALDEDAASAWRVTEDNAIAAGPSAAISLAGSVRLAFAHIKAIAPEAKVVVLTPLQCTEITADRMSRGSDLIESAAKLGGAYVIRQDSEMPVDSAAERRHYNLTYDGVHTSEAGARANGEAIARRISSLLAQ